jgi:3,5-epimerase/4-reductase
MNERTLILGGRGFLGQRLRDAWGCPATDHKIYTMQDAERIMDEFQPKLVINCIGYNGVKNVDDCDRDPDKTYMSNTFVPIMLAELALRRGFKLVQISSGCIYHYDHRVQAPRTEQDPPDYFDLAYSRSKIACEWGLLGLMPRLNALIVRVRIPLDDRPHVRNILDRLVQFKKVINIPNSVTYVPDFMRALEHLIQQDARGLFNVVNKGVLLYPELLDVYRKYVRDFNYEVIDFEKLAIKRTNVVLSTEKLEKTGFKLRNIREVFEECVQNHLVSL